MKFIKVEDELPYIGKDIIAYNANNGSIDIGFRSELDDDINDWIDFNFRVTHWAYVTLPE